jgi:hypothetical protein
MVADNNKKKRKKRPPPSPKKQIDPTLEIVPVSNSESVSTPMVEDVGYKWFRRLAELTYVTTQENISVRKLSELPEFKGKVHRKTLENWCIAGKWVEKRVAYFNGLQEQIKQKVASAQVQSRVTQLKKYETIFQECIGKLSETEPGTYEGMIRAALQLGKFMEELRTLISAEVVPEKMSSANNGDHTVVPQLTDEEAYAGAMAVVAMRKEALKKANESSDD